MARKDYIEKITQNLEHLTKDELKDVATLTNAQFGVRLKVAEKEYWGKEVINLKSQLQQQALPVVPECVGEWIDKNISVAHNAELMIHNILICAIDNKNRYLFPMEVEKFVLKNPIIFLNAVITGKYQVEKPQLFEVKMPIVYWDDDASQLINGFDFLRIDKETDEVDFIGFLSNTKKHTVYFTEQEIKSIDDRYWQFAVPVEDGE